MCLEIQHKHFFQWFRTPYAKRAVYWRHMINYVFMNVHVCLNGCSTNKTVKHNVVTCTNELKSCIFMLLHRIFASNLPEFTYQKIQKLCFHFCHRYRGFVGACVHLRSWRKEFCSESHAHAFWKVLHFSSSYQLGYLKCAK